MPKLQAVALLVLATGVFLSTASAADDDPAVEWLGDYKQALAEAKRTNKPIFLEYRCEP
jgi:hypothetical protein